MHFFCCSLIFVLRNAISQLFLHVLHGFLVGLGPGTLTSDDSFAPATSGSTFGFCLIILRVLLLLFSR